MEKYNVDQNRIYIFNKGLDYQAYNVFGAHIIKYDGKTGIRFLVYAPNARNVSVVGNFNDWDKNKNPMEKFGDTGCFITFVEGLKENELYKYLIETSDGSEIYKADPFGFYAEVRPNTASITYDIEGFKWTDDKYMKKRSEINHFDIPKNIYECHLGSFIQHKSNIERKSQDDVPKEDFYTYRELADKLIAKKERRHAPEIETTESKLIIDDNGICCGVLPRERGKSERIIEEFMLTANEAAAKLAREKEIPFVYRIHEAPPEAKVENLHEVLPKFGLECPHFTEFKPHHAAEILRSAKGTDKFEAVNLMVLRSMAKAKYSTEPVGHFGLVLEDYAHFTSPIRRYPDLAIHRIITDILAGYDNKWLNKRYSGFAVNAAERSSAAEIRAVTIERECEDCYKAEYMKAHIGETFRARISSVTEFGFYAELPNTVEGLVHIRTLPEGQYDYSEPVSLTEKFTGTSYSLGMEVDVICSAVNVSEGTIDFVLDDDEED